MIGTESCLQWEYEGPPVKETFHIPRSPRPNGIVQDTHALPSGRLFWVHETVDSTSLVAGNAFQAYQSSIMVGNRLHVKSWPF